MKKKSFFYIYLCYEYKYMHEMNSEGPWSEKADVMNQVSLFFLYNKPLSE